MGLCCCGFTHHKVVKDSSTQTDMIPLVESDMKRETVDREARCRSSIETALRLVQQAVEADKSRRYEEALSLYQHALVYFLESLNYETESEVVKNKILSKCKQYLDRAEKLAEYLRANNLARRTKPSSLTDVSESVSRWIHEEAENAQENQTPRSAVSRMYHSIIRKSRRTQESGEASQHRQNFHRSSSSKTFFNRKSST